MCQLEGISYFAMTETSPPGEIVAGFTLTSQLIVPLCFPEFNDGKSGFCAGSGTDGTVAIQTKRAMEMVASRGVAEGRDDGSAEFFMEYSTIGFRAWFRRPATVCREPSRRRGKVNLGNDLYILR